MVAKTGFANGKRWYLSHALISLEENVNAAWPNRSKRSDGSIGDTSHQSRASKHNPQLPDEEVQALDITHDPAPQSCNAVILADNIANSVKAGLEKRVSGIGSWNPATNSERWFSRRFWIWGWRDQDLNGASHETHMHLVTLPGAPAGPWHIQAIAPSLNPSLIKKIIALFIPPNPTKGNNNMLSITNGVVTHSVLVSPDGTSLHAYNCEPFDKSDKAHKVQSAYGIQSWSTTSGPIRGIARGDDPSRILMVKANGEGQVRMVKPWVVV